MEARELLGRCPVLNRNARAEAILDHALQLYGLELGDIRGPRDADAVECKRLASYAIRQATNLGYVDIARTVMGHENHSTVYDHVQKGMGMVKRGHPDFNEQFSHWAEAIILRDRIRRARPHQRQQPTGHDTNSQNPGDVRLRDSGEHG